MRYLNTTCIPRKHPLKKDLMRYCIYNKCIPDYSNHLHKKDLLRWCQRNESTKIIKRWWNKTRKTKIQKLQSPKKLKKRKKRKKTKTKIKFVNDQCPITLEKLTELENPLFHLKFKNVNVGYDGVAFSEYIMNSGKLECVLTRLPLTEEHDKELDLYLLKHKNNPVRQIAGVRHNQFFYQEMEECSGVVNACVEEIVFYVSDIIEYIKQMLSDTIINGLSHLPDRLAFRHIIYIMDEMVLSKLAQFRSPLEDIIGIYQRYKLLQNNIKNEFARINEAFKEGFETIPNGIFSDDLQRCKIRIYNQLNTLTCNVYEFHIN